MFAHGRTHASVPDSLHQQRWCTHQVMWLQDSCLRLVLRAQHWIVYEYSGCSARKLKEREELLTCAVLCLHRTSTDAANCHSMEIWPKCPDHHPSLLQPHHSQHVSHLPVNPMHPRCSHSQRSHLQVGRVVAPQLAQHEPRAQHCLQQLCLTRAWEGMEMRIKTWFKCNQWCGVWGEVGCGL